MRKTLIAVTVFLLVSVLSLAVSAEELVFFDSFEDNTIGEKPAGWELTHDLAAQVVDAASGRVSDGNLAVVLNNTPDLYGEIVQEIPEVVEGKMMVDFYQPSAIRDNINIEVHSASGRLIGVFVTGSGNVRPRPAGQQTENLVNLPNDRWHTLVLTWNAEGFNVYYLDAVGNQIVILENAEFDPVGVEGGAASKILLNVSRREDLKQAYFDNVRVYDLAK